MKGSILIAGLGNVLCGDDAVGPTVAHYLKARCEFGPEVEVLDLGTPGFDLAYQMMGREQVVLVDAMMAKGERLGAVKVVDASGGVSQDAHSLAIGEAIRLMKFQGKGAGVVRLVGVVVESCEAGTKMSAGLMGRLEQVLIDLMFLLVEWGIPLRVKEMGGRPELWWLPEAPECGDDDTAHRV